MKKNSINNTVAINSTEEEKKMKNNSNITHEMIAALKDYAGSVVATMEKDRSIFCGWLNPNRIMINLDDEKNNRIWSFHFKRARKQTWEVRVYDYETCTEVAVFTFNTKPKSIDEKKPSATIEKRKADPALAGKPINEKKQPSPIAYTDMPGNVNVTINNVKINVYHRTK